MDKAEYLDKISRCSVAAGPGGPDWNALFVANLYLNGLRLLPGRHRRTDGCDVAAPVPHEEGAVSYAYPSTVVPLEAEDASA